HCSLDGSPFTVREPSADAAGFAGGEETSLEDLLTIKAPMPGKVIKICVVAGDSVKKKQTLVIVEAMKMENEIKAGLDAVVKKVNAAPGDLVDPSKVLIELTAD
ncbi:MAG: acetyl-CoA carboxylase biotin carboxyl carrier protein subunit, partial [Candidatus Aminicenantes bacterium]|nr:acetyl-CoA carboxylase biotin carboxyl carrier protein subunit [Candidatus Aminicenantes bacterium]